VKAPHQVFQRPPGAGWLVLGGAWPQRHDLAWELLDQVRRRAGEGDLLLLAPGLALEGGRQALHDLLGNSLEGLRSVSLDRARGLEDWTTGALLLADGPLEEWLDGLEWLGRSIYSRFQQGSLVCAWGAAAGAMGRWVIDEQGQVMPGVGWLPNAVLLPWHARPTELPQVRQLLSQGHDIYALGMEGERWIALGPGGEVESWGPQAPTLVLGAGWSQDGARANAESSGAAGP